MHGPQVAEGVRSAVAKPRDVVNLDRFRSNDRSATDSAEQWAAAAEDKRGLCANRSGVALILGGPMAGSMEGLSARTAETFPTSWARPPAAAARDQPHARS